MPEITFVVRISSWNFGRVPKAWLEILIRSTISAIHKFLENILESSYVHETTPWSSESKMAKHPKAAATFKLQWIWKSTNYNKTCWGHAMIPDCQQDLQSVLALQGLTHWGWDKMAVILQTTVSNAFSWMKMCKFCLKFHWTLFSRVQWTIFRHWFR